MPLAQRSAEPVRPDRLQKRIDLNGETITQAAATKPGSSG